MQGTPSRRPAAGAVRSGNTAEHHQPVVPAARSRRHGAMRRRRGASSASRCARAGSTTPSPKACRCGRSRSRPTAFGTDARVEVTMPPGQGASEICQDRLRRSGSHAARRARRTIGRVRFRCAHEAGGGRVLRFEPSGATLARGWQPAAGDPEVGFSTPAAAAMAASRSATVMQRRFDRNACAGSLDERRATARGRTALAGQLAPGGPKRERPAGQRPARRPPTGWADRFRRPARGRHSARSHGRRRDRRACARRAAGRARRPAPPSPGRRRANRRTAAGRRLRAGAG